MTTPIRSHLALLVLLAAMALAGRATAQGETQVSARLSAGVLRLGDAGTINVTVENAADGRILAVPKVEGLQFDKPQGPSLRQSTSFVNGRVYTERTLVFAIPFRPQAEGDFEIPPITVEADGRRFETKPLRATVRVDLKGADFGYVEVHPSAPHVIEGQPFTVELIFGWDVREQVTFAELNLPWWDSLPGAIEVGEQEIPGDKRVPGIVVNGSFQVTAEQLEGRERNGRTFITLRLIKSYLPSRSGSLEFPTSFFEFGRSRQVSIFDTRRESHFVQAPAFTVEVVPLPSEGQPIDFSGAVGTIAARASADTRDVRVGDSIKFAVEWTGQGNLKFFRPPDLGALDAFRGFRVYGSTEEKALDRRKVVYDISPLSADVREIPAVPLSVYDPVAKRYDSVATAPIPVRVRALEKGATLSDDERRFERDIADIDPEPPVPASAGRGALQDRLLVGALVAMPLLGLLTRRRLRLESGDPAAPLERRRRRAVRQLARALERDPSPPAQLAALLEFLAARTREDGAAWNGRDLEHWAAHEATGLPPEVVRQASAVLRELEAAVYGGGRAPDAERVRSAARELVEAGL